MARPKGFEPLAFAFGGQGFNDLFGLLQFTQSIQNIRNEGQLDFSRIPV